MFKEFFQKQTAEEFIAECDQMIEDLDFFLEQIDQDPTLTEGIACDAAKASIAANKERVKNAKVRAKGCKGKTNKDAVAKCLGDESDAIAKAKEAIKLAKIRKKSDCTIMKKLFGD